MKLYREMGNHFEATPLFNSSNIPGSEPEGELEEFQEIKVPVIAP